VDSSTFYFQLRSAFGYGPGWMDYEVVKYKVAGGIATVTLNNPEKRNMLSGQMLTELVDAMKAARDDEEVRAVVLTGAGDKAFCAGQDLKELGERLRSGPVHSSLGSRGLPGHPRLTDRFTMAKPIVARVNGLALGGGLELALACDVVVAAEHAFFGLPEARLGLVPGAGGVFRLTRQAPFRTALGHLLTGRRFTAAQALGWGLVNDVVPAADLDACVAGWVSDILACAPLAVRAVKQLAHESAELPLPAAFTAGYEWEKRRAASEDAREGPLAFLERRAPVWKGR
jgi:dehydration protein DpgD